MNKDTKYAYVIRAGDKYFKRRSFGDTPEWVDDIADATWFGYAYVINAGDKYYKKRSFGDTPEWVDDIADATWFASEEAAQYRCQAWWPKAKVLWLMVRNN